MTTGHDRLAIIGGYTDSSGAAPRGLGLYREDVGGAGWQLVHRLELMNPTFGAFDSERDILYTSHSKKDCVSAVALQRDQGRLRLINRAATGSVNPAHLALSPDRRFLVAASFTSGHVSVIEVRESGDLGDLVAATPTEGSPGPLRAQSGSQPHQVVFSGDGKHIFVPDRGCDRVLVYRFDQATGELQPVKGAAARPAAGPRHLVFVDTETAWVVNELDSTLSSYHWDGGSETLSPVNVQSTLPDDYFGASSGGGIAASTDRGFLYVSNRGHDSITTFRLTDGHHATCLGWTPVGGRTPRFLGSDPVSGDLWVTAQDSDLVQRFTIDPISGAPTLAESLPFASPACVTFA